MSRPPQDPLARFCHQYLQLEKDLDYPAPDLLREAPVQDGLYKNLFAEGAVPRPTPQRYHFRVLKELLRRIEASIDDWDKHAVSDDLMSAFGEMLATPVPPEAETIQQMDYVTYHLSLLPSNSAAASASASASASTPGVLANCITLRESRGLLATAGVTGFRTWEAGLHLGQYLCRHPDIVRGKRVLELGSGTGYVAVLCAKYLGATKVTASDHSGEVLNGLSETAYLNGLQGSGAFVSMELSWGHALAGAGDGERWDGGEGVDVVLGADLTYDPRIIPPLLATLGELFDMYPGRLKALISMAVRSGATLDILMRLCEGAGMVMDFVDFPAPARAEQQGPFYDSSVPIHIMEVRRKPA